jgi:hypothetical protein
VGSGSGDSGDSGRNSGTDRKFTSDYGVGSARFSKLPVRPQVPPSTSVYASTVALASNSARLEARMESLLLFCRALSSPTMCRFSRRSLSPPIPPLNRATNGFTATDY